VKKMYRRGKAWYSDFWYKGQRYIQSWGAISKTGAKEKDEKFKTEVREGKYQKKRDNPVFEVLIDEFLNMYSSNKKSYKADMARAKQLLRFFKGRKVLDIANNSFLVERYKDMRKKELIERGIKAGKDIKEISFATVNRELAFLKTAFNWLRKKPGCRNIANPVAGVKMFPEKSRDRILEYDEEPKLFEAIESNPKAQHLKPITITALNTGLRLQEVLKLKKTDVDFRLECIIARDTKNGEDRIIPMNSILTETLREVINNGNKNSEYVFAKEDGKPYRNITRSLKTACKKAGIENFTFHCFRHTFGTRLGEKNIHPKAIGELGGWKDLRMVMRYTHPTPEYKKKAVESLCEVPSKVPTSQVVPISVLNVSSRNL